MSDPTSNPLAQVCSCRWHEGLREPGIDCPVHPRPAPGKERFRKVESSTPWRLLPCRLCGSPAELWQRWSRDDVWDSFGACTNLEDVNGEACQFHLPDSPHFYRERKTDAVRHWNLIMGPRGAVETAPRRIPTNVDVDYVLQVYKPETIGGRDYVYVDSPTVAGLHCEAEGAEAALAVAPALVARLRKDNAHLQESPVETTGCPATWQPVVNGPIVRCTLPLGHKGKHKAPEPYSSVETSGTLEELIGQSCEECGFIGRTHKPTCSRSTVKASAGQRLHRECLDEDVEEAIKLHGPMIPECPGDGCKGCAGCRQPVDTPPENEKGDR